VEVHDLLADNVQVVSRTRRQPNKSGLVIGAADRPSGQRFFSESEWAAQKLIDLAELGR
jgi:hypothetical protein